VTLGGCAGAGKAAGRITPATADNATMTSGLATARAAQAAAAEAYRADPFSGSARARAAKANRELKAAELAARTDENVPPTSPTGNQQGHTDSLPDAHVEAAGLASTGQNEGEHKEQLHGPVQEKFRLFVTGWPASVGSDAMVNKLRSFGRVHDDVVVSRRKPLGGGSSSDGEPFAHLTLETDYNKMTKCMKALNGSMWLDRKLRIERANEHYPDRIKRETQEAAVPEADLVAESAGGLAAYQAPITRLRISDPHLPRRRRKRSQIIVELDRSNVPNKIRFNDAGEPIATSAGGREPSRSLADEAKAAADAPAPDSDDEMQESSAAAQEPVDVSTDAGIRRMLIEQGFIDSSDEEDVGPAPSATGMTARGEAAEEDGVDIAKETKDSMNVLSKIFGEKESEMNPTKDQADADIEEQRKAGPGGLTGMFWVDPLRYDPTTPNAAELELEGDVMLGGAKAAQLNDAPEVSGEKQYLTGSIADLFTKRDPGEKEDTGLQMQTTGANEAVAALRAATAAGVDGVLAGAAMLEAQRPKFTLLGNAEAAADLDGCRFMRTETAEEVQTQWREERELYTLDYKKRRRDALRRRTLRGGGGTGRGGRGRGGGGSGGG
jgi:hypothetical protein